jgi:pyruvate decarboxylase
MVKGALNEQIPQFAGVHQGIGKHPVVKEAIEGTDFVLWIGNYPVTEVRHRSRCLPISA